MAKNDNKQGAGASGAKAADAHYAERAEHEEGVQEVVENAIALVSSAELNQQVVTARRFPRSVTQFRRDALELSTMDVEIAEACFYAVPRAGKMIVGPSIRFAEILQSCWGNCRVSSGITRIDHEYVYAEGIFFDLEKNSATKADIMRSIIGKKGDRYSQDMIAQTGNAGAAIARRNAILAGVPKAFWSDISEQVKKVIAGDSKTFVARRDSAMKELGVMGVTPDMIFAKLEVKGIDDLKVEHLVTLGAIRNSIRDEVMSIEEAFAVTAADGTITPPRPKQSEFERKPAAEKQPEQKAADPQPTAQQAEPQPKAEESTVKPSDSKSAAHDVLAAFLEEAVADIGKIASIRDLADMAQNTEEQLAGHDDLLAEWKEAVTTRQKEILSARKPGGAK